MLIKRESSDPNSEFEILRFELDILELFPQL